MSTPVGRISTTIVTKSLYYLILCDKIIILFIRLFSPRVVEKVQELRNYTVGFVSYSILLYSKTETFTQTPLLLVFILLWALFLYYLSTFVLRVVFFFLKRVYHTKRRAMGLYKISACSKIAVDLFFLAGS